MEPRELAQHAAEIVHEFDVLFPRQGENPASASTDALIVRLAVEAYRHYLFDLHNREAAAHDLEIEKRRSEMRVKENVAIGQQMVAAFGALPKLIAKITSGKETLDLSDPKTQEELARSTQHFLRELERQSAPSEEASPDPSIPSSSEPEAPKPKAAEPPLPEKQEGS